MSELARRHGVNGNPVIGWRRRMAQGALTAAAAGEEVMPSEHRALEAQVRERQRMLGKKAMENEIGREAVSRAGVGKRGALHVISSPEVGP